MSKTVTVDIQDRARTTVPNAPCHATVPVSTTVPRPCPSTTVSGCATRSSARPELSFSERNSARSGLQQAISASAGFCPSIPLLFADAISNGDAMRWISSVFGALLILIGPCAVAHAQVPSLAVMPEGDLRLERAADVSAVVPLAGGNILVLGHIDRVDGAHASGVALLSNIGRPVSAFRPRCATGELIPGQISCLVAYHPLRDGSFLISGTFAQINGRPIPRLARFRSDGSLDEQFQIPSLQFAWRFTGVVGESDGFVYVRFNDEFLAGDIRRVNLAAPRLIDPAYAANGIRGAFAFDDTGTLYEVHRIAGASDVRLRRRTGTGTVDLTWEADLPDVDHGVWYDSTIGRIFVATAQSVAPPAKVSLITANGGIDPEWTPELLSGSTRSSLLGVAGRRPGRLLTRQQVEGQVRLVLHDTATGRALASTSDPELATLSYSPGADGSWYSTALRSDRTYPIVEPIVRLLSTLERDVTLRTRLRRLGVALYASHDRSGGLLVAGDFKEAGGVSRARVTRLNADGTVDLAWSQANQPFGPLPLRWVGQGSDGTLATAEYETRPVFWFGFRVTPALGTPTVLFPSISGPFESRRHLGSILVDDYIYGGEICSPRAPAFFGTGLWRFKLSRTLLTPTSDTWFGCSPEPGWGPVAGGIPSSPFAYADGFLYFVTGWATQTTLRRISHAPGSVPDPHFAVTINRESAGFVLPALTAMRVSGGFLYLAGTFTSVGGSPTGGLVRVNATSGVLDPTWPSASVSPRDAELEIVGTEIYRLADTDVDSRRKLFELSAFSAIDGQVSTVINIQASDVRLTNSAQPLPTILALGDSRALVTGNFWRIDGVERDGFAIVGMPERLHADGFEAPR